MKLDAESKIWELEIWEPETYAADENKKYSLSELFPIFGRIDSGRCNAVNPLTFHLFITHPYVNQEKQDEIWAHVEIDVSYCTESERFILSGNLTRALVIGGEEEIYLKNVIEGFKLDENISTWECEEC